MIRVVGVVGYGPEGFEVRAWMSGDLGGTRERTVWASGHCTLEAAEEVATALRFDPARLAAAWQSPERPDRRAP